MSDPITGGCLCGACTYRTDAPPINVRACHCRLCQKAIGASFNARVMVPYGAVEIAGPVSWYGSSEDLRRGFCSNCGTTMFSHRASLDAVGLTMGSLDDPDRFTPAAHIWMSRKQAWLALDDGMPCYAEGPPA